MRSPALVTGGWESRGYKDFRSLAPALVRRDETEGYAFLLRLVFEDLSHELPGLFGAAGVAELVPVPAATLRHAIEELNKPELETCWTDDMTLGWVYQYWNDPEREALDAKLNSGGKVEPHEIASKTQMFTERYMVDWLLQNSLGPMWLAMCKKHGWTPEVEADGTLDRLEECRVEWRAKRESGEVSLTELMPLHTDAERRWAYYVPQPIPDDAVEKAPESVRELKILDPAVGSGHFLVVAMELLVALYREEARHRGEAWNDRAIVEWILEGNLHGIDLDPRAVQIAAAALWLKAKSVAPDARPGRLNLVASNLRLASLPNEDSALVELRRDVERETGVPGELTDTIVHALRGADHLGSLLKVDVAVEKALERYESELSKQQPDQGDLFRGFGENTRISVTRDEARVTLFDRLNAFLGRRTGAEDLGLRLRGEQLAAGIRFIRLLQEGAYDLVVGNPPYQGSQRLSDTSYIDAHYRVAKEDLYATFIARSLQLLRQSGIVGLITIRSWMFVSHFRGLRQQLLDNCDLCLLADLGVGGFEAVPGVEAAMLILRNVPQGHSLSSTALRADGSKRSDLLCEASKFDFSARLVRQVDGSPIVYQWKADDINRYLEVPKLGDSAPARVGMKTSNNTRFVRAPWEVAVGAIDAVLVESSAVPTSKWTPYIKGAGGKAWLEPLSDVVLWSSNGIEIRLALQRAYGQGPQCESQYFVPGVAFTTIARRFLARAHRYRSIFDVAGSSVFHPDTAAIVCLLNSERARRFVEGINPTINFQVGDVNRLPLFTVSNSKEVFQTIKTAFAIHERHREPSIEFKAPGGSPWRSTQDWAQKIVDSAEGAPLPPYDPKYDAEPPTDHLSFALGVALGRFGANGEGILDPSKDDLSSALPAGVLFLDGMLDGDDLRDGLGHPSVALLHRAWNDHGNSIETRRNSLREYLRIDFFASVHRTMYENRPIHWPLSSSGKTFVAWVNIHRFTEQTLHILLADHLHPTLTRIEGELEDLRQARDGANKKAARTAEKLLDKRVKAKEELAAFIADVEQCADKGPAPTGVKCSVREGDSRYAPDLDDGVMVNSAALWKLLEPQWRDPKKWWKELATAQHKKDFDWSHLAKRYFPGRVEAKCQEDPSLGVAHGCFWRHHPERAWAWELRLQSDIGPDFCIAESDATVHRDAWIRDHAQEALAAVEKEAVRRMGRGKKRNLISKMRILEHGLWSSLPEEVWAMELRLSERQGAEFRLTSPDEAVARSELELAHPDELRQRSTILADLRPPQDLFDEPPRLSIESGPVKESNATCR